MLAVLVVSSMTTTVQTKAGDGRCRALALSGGGSRGAFEAGALWGLYHAMEDKSEMEYDVVTGVSAGSINMFGVALFDKGKEGEMVEFISQAW